MPEVKYLYIADGSAVVNENKKIEDSGRRADAAMNSLGTKGQAALGGLEKSAVAAGQGAAVAGQGLAVLEQVAVSADPKIAGLFAQLASMKGELAAIPVVTQAAATGITGTTGATTGLVAAFGSLTAVWAFAIPVAINVIGVLFELLTAKEKLIKIDKEQLDFDLRRNDLAERTTRIHADLVTAFRLVASQQKEYQLNTAKLNFDLDALARGSETRLVTDQKTGLSYQQLHRNASELAKGVAQLNETLGEQEKILQPALEVILRHKVATGESTEETLKWAEAVGHFGGDAIDFFRQRLNALIPDIDEFTKKINALKLARPDVGSSLPGIGALQASVEATFQLARDQGITDWAEQVKFATPALKALDEALRQHAGTLKGYRAEIAAQEPGMRAAIELMKEQQRVLAEEFAARKKVREVGDIGPRLELEFLRASIALRKEDFVRREELIRREFEIRREEMIKNRQGSEENLLRLRAIEGVHLAALLNENSEYLEKLQAKRREAQLKQEIIWLKEFDAFKAHLVRQRQVREDEERKFLENKVKIERAALIAEGRETRFFLQQEAIQRAELTARFATRGGGGLVTLPDRGKIDQAITGLRELGLTARQVDEFFAGTSISVDQLNTRIGILTQSNISAAQTFSQLVDWQAVLTAGIHAFTNAIGAAIAGTENLGRALLVGFLQIIAEICITLGTMFILAAAGFIALPGFQWTAGQLAAAGIALLAFGAVLGGLAQRFAQEKSPEESAAAGGVGASSGGGGRQNQGPPNQIVPFPTAGPNGTQITIINKLDRSGTNDFLKGKGVVTATSMRSEHAGEIQRVSRRARTRRTG